MIPVPRSHMSKDPSGQSYCAQGARRVRRGKTCEVLGPVDFDNLPPERKCQVCANARRKQLEASKERAAWRKDRDQMQGAVHAADAHPFAAKGEPVDTTESVFPGYIAVADQAGLLFSECFATLDLLESVNPHDVGRQTVSVAASGVSGRLETLKELFDKVVDEVRALS